jgi:hypothetical protein
LVGSGDSKMLALEIPKTSYVMPTLQTRYTFEHPTDHNRGIAFGEKNGPAIALVGAVSAISAGAAIGGILGGVIIAGGIASGLGALTGNKTLSTIGMGLSLAGGVGSAFTNSATGEFMNPFSEGFEFGDTSLGAGFSKIKSFFSDVTGTSSAVNDLNITADSIVDSATPDTLATIESGSDGAVIRGIDNNVTSGGNIRQVIGDASSGISDVTSKSSGGGLLSSIGGGKDLLNLVSGVAGGYQDNQTLEQQQPLFDARVDQTNAETQLLQNRYNNMQGQPGVGLDVNQNAQVFNATPGTAQGKYAVVVNGEVKYVSQAEYDAMRTQQGGGLINQGAPA